MAKRKHIFECGEASPAPLPICPEKSLYSCPCLDLFHPVHWYFLDAWKGQACTFQPGESGGCSLVSLSRHSPTLALRPLNPSNSPLSPLQYPLHPVTVTLCFRIKTSAGSTSPIWVNPVYPTSATLLRTRGMSSHPRTFAFAPFFCLDDHGPSSLG